jgi:hypothetical protein
VTYIYTYTAQSLGYGSYVVRDEFGHPVQRPDRTFAQFASADRAVRYAAELTSRPAEAARTAFNI